MCRCVSVLFLPIDKPTHNDKSTSALTLTNRALWKWVSNHSKRSEKDLKVATMVLVPIGTA